MVYYCYLLLFFVCHFWQETKKTEFTVTVKFIRVICDVILRNGIQLQILAQSHKKEEIYSANIIHYKKQRQHTDCFKNILL